MTQTITVTEKDSKGKVLSTVTLPETDDYTELVILTSSGATRIPIVELQELIISPSSQGELISNDSWVLPIYFPDTSVFATVTLSATYSEMAVVSEKGAYLFTLSSVDIDFPLVGYVGKGHRAYHIPRYEPNTVIEGTYVYRGYATSGSNHLKVQFEKDFGLLPWGATFVECEVSINDIELGFWDVKVVSIHTTTSPVSGVIHVNAAIMRIHDHDKDGNIHSDYFQTLDGTDVTVTLVRIEGMRTR